MTDYQGLLDEAFFRFERGDLDRREYVVMVDDILSGIPQPLLDRRRDTRSPGEFALAIYDTTVRERHLINLWAGDRPVADHGLANDGRLILNTRGKNGRPDFTVDGLHVEVKFDPTRSFVTYKVADLENYVRRGDVVVLTFIGDATMIGGNGDPDHDGSIELSDDLLWFSMDANQCQKLLEEGERGHHKGFGGKPTVRVYKREFSRFFILERQHAHS